MALLICQRLGSGRRLRAVLLVLVSAVCLAGTGHALAQDATQLQQQIKVAFLFKFAGYVDWPAADAGEPFTIAVVSRNVAQDLARVIGDRTLNGRPVSIRQIRAGESVLNVNVLYIGHSAEPGILALLDAARGQPILTVTDADGGLGRGSVINFVPVGGKVRFEVSLDAAERNGLKLSAPLLSVALRVTTGEP